MSVGKRISELRRKKGFTQEYVAEQLGVSRQAVSKWESDASYPSTENLLQLSDILGVSLTEITASEKEPKQRSPLEEYACQRLREEQVWKNRIKRVLVTSVQIGLIIAYFLILHYVCWFLDECLGRRIYIFAWLCKNNVLLLSSLVCILFIFIKRPLACFGICIGSAIGIILGHFVAQDASVSSPVNMNNGWVFYLAAVYLLSLIGLVFDYRHSSAELSNKFIKTVLPILVAIALSVFLFQGVSHVRRVYGANLGYQEGFEAGAADAEQGYDMGERYQGIIPEPEGILYFDFAYFGYKMYWYSGYVEGYNSWLQIDLGG